MPLHEFPSETLPACVACRWLRLHRDGHLACLAYPNGVPPRLLRGQLSHRSPYPGDRGIRFEPDGDAPAEVLALLRLPRVRL